DRRDTSLPRPPRAVVTATIVVDSYDQHVELEQKFLKRVLGWQRDGRQLGSGQSVPFELRQQPVRLRPPQVVEVVGLAGEVAAVDQVMLDDSQAPSPGSGQRHGHPTTDPTGPDNPNPCPFKRI